MDSERIPTNQEKKVEELHWEIQQWKSSLQFMEDEIVFFLRLLGSYAFQPNTPNLFERLQDFKMRIEKSKKFTQDVKVLISKHENIMGGMLECTDSTCDISYYRKHDELGTRVDTCIANFRKLKSEIFNYAGGILKRRKPIDS